MADASGKHSKEHRHNNVFIKPMMSAKRIEESSACLFSRWLSFFTYDNVAGAL